MIAVCVGVFGHHDVDMVLMWHREQCDPERVQQSFGAQDLVRPPCRNDPTSEQDLYVLAGKKMDAAARESDLVTKAEANTTSMLQGLLGKLGFQNVHVAFTKPLAAAADPASR